MLSVVNDSNAVCATARITMPSLIRRRHGNDVERRLLQLRLVRRELDLRLPDDFVAYSFVGSIPALYRSIFA